MPLPLHALAYNLPAHAGDAGAEQTIRSIGQGAVRVDMCN